MIESVTERSAILFLLLLAACLKAQDITGQNLTANRIRSGTALPTACVAGQIFDKTNATAGLNIYVCTTPGNPGTWSLQSGVSTAVAVIALFTGCSGTQYLGADGACHTASSGALPAGTKVTDVQCWASATTLGVCANEIITGTYTGAAFSTGGTPPALTPGTGGAVGYSEGTVPSVGAAAGVDVVYADSTQHGFLASFNNGSYLPLVQGPASATSGHVATFSGTNGGLLSDGGTLPTVTGGTCTNQAVTAISTSAVPTCTTLTSAYVNNSIALTGTDINTSNQVTVTHLAAALPVNQGGTGITSFGTGVATALGTNVSGSGAICLATGSACAPNAGTVTSVSFTGGLISVATATTTPALTVAGTSGGIPYFSGAATWASSAAGTQNDVIAWGGTGNAPVDSGILYTNLALLNAANLFTTNVQTITLAPAAATVTDGWRFYDTTAASAGNQQYSPSLHFQGQGWKTTATAASQAVDFRAYVQPIQGAANPTGYLVFQSAINGGAFGSDISITSGGGLGIGCLNSANNPSWQRTTTVALSVSCDGNTYTGVAGSAIYVPSGGFLAFNNTSSPAPSNNDISVDRDAAGILGISAGGSSTTAANYRAIKASAHYVAGTTFTASGCSNGTLVGGATGGKLTLGANNCTVVVTMGNSATATNGWNCAPEDQTTAALTAGVYQSASTTTTVTFTIPGTAGSTDVISFACMGY